MTIDPNVVNIYYHFALDYRKQGGMYGTTLQSPPPPKHRTPMYATTRFPERGTLMHTATPSNHPHPPPTHPHTHITTFVSNSRGVFN